MVIKTISRQHKHLSFSKLIAYVNKTEAPNLGLEQLRFYHNIEGVSQSEVAQEFETNLGYKAVRANGLGCYHEILTFHNDDSKNLTLAIVQDLVNKYIEERAKNANALVYGGVHQDTDNLHVHLVVSSNGLMTSKANRLSKSEFLKIREKIETYQKERYPELRHSTVYLDKADIKRGITKEEDKNTRTRNYQQLKNRLGNGQETEKERLKILVLRSYEEASSKEKFYELLEQGGLELYKYRDKVCGVKSGRKYRFKTLGVDRDKIKALETKSIDNQILDKYSRHRNIYGKGNFPDKNDKGRGMDREIPFDKDKPL